MENLRFEWTSESAKTLGKTFSYEKDKLIENNLLPKLNDFVYCLKRWNHRKLSLMGKVTVVNTFALSKLICPLTVLDDPPVHIINKIKSEIFYFIFDSKPDKIKRSVLMQDYKNGGLKLLNLDYFIGALKAGYIRRIFDENNKASGKNFIWRNLILLEGKCY